MLNTLRKMRASAGDEVQGESSIVALRAIRFIITIGVWILNWN